MDKEVFGSPDAHDATAEWDKLVEEAGQDHAEMFEIARTEVMNRQVGSKKVSAKDQLQEWEILRSEPSSLMEFFGNQDATLEEAINYAFNMEHKLRNV